MKRFIPALLAAALLALALTPLVGQQKTDLNYQQSPPKPQPEGLKFIDQGQFDPRLKGYRAPEGFKLEIVADHPVVTNPVGMTFGPDGTLYVLEWVAAEGVNFPESYVIFTYKDGTKKKVAIMKKPVKDLVKVLSYNAAKGVYDKAKVILEDELPSSILVHDGWIYLTSQGTVRRYQQTKADGPYDKKEVIAQGFCGFHHHQVSGLTIGNDGWLYVTSGDDDNFVEGSDGSRANVLRTGAIFRCRPDGSKLHTYALGFRNPYRDVAFDTAFNMFHVDNDNEDGSKWTGCRLMHVPEGADFGWRLFIGARCCKPDFVRSAVQGELPGKMAPLLKTGRGSPAGLLIYNDTRLPEQYQGLLYYPDVFRKLIRAYRVTNKQSTFEVTHEFEFLKSDDPLFRPCQMVLGPDGAMYVCDWRTDSGGAGKLWGDGQHGRIYRLTWVGTKDQPKLERRGLDSWQKITKLADDDLLKAFASEDFSDRQRARNEAAKRGEKLRPALLKLLKNEEQPAVARVAALGALHATWDDEVAKVAVKMLGEPEPDIRRLAAEALALNTRPGDKDVHEGLVQHLNDNDPAARRAVYLAIGHVGAAGAADVLTTALQFDAGKDAYLRDGLARAIELLGKQGMDKLLALTDTGDERDSNKVVEVFLTLRTRDAALALPTLLKKYHLTPAQKAELLHSYNNYQLDPPLPLDPVIDFLKALPRPKENPPTAKEKDMLQQQVPVKLAGLSVLNAGGTIARDKVDALVVELFDDADPQVRVGATRALGNTAFGKLTPRLIERLADGQRTLEERLAVVAALGAFKTKEAVGPLQTLAGNKDQDTNLRQEALRALAATDAAASQKVAAALLEDKHAALQEQAILVLGAQPQGAQLVAEHFLAKKLPPALLAQVADVLRKHSAKNAKLAQLLTEVTKGGLTVSLTPAELPRLRELVRSQGDALRGRELYLNNKALACMSCHQLEGVGGNVGPDLTRVWDTHSVDKVMEAILEPSKEIKEGYQSYIATTTAGRIITGLRVSQNAEGVTIREANGKDTRITAKDLDTLVASKKSLMPDDVVKHLTFGQFLDLVAFLKDRKAQEALRGMALEYWVVGPFGADFKKAGAPEKNPKVGTVYDPEKSEKPLGWLAVQTDAKGYLNLEIFGKPTNPPSISVYVQTFVYSPEPQAVQMYPGGQVPLRIWVNGKQVADFDKKLATEKERVQVSLNAGWNAVLARVAHGGEGPGLYLRFAGTGLRLSLRPEQK